MGILKNITYKNFTESGLSKIAFLLVVLFTGIFFFVLNRLYPLYLDDWTYSFKYPNGGEIESFWDIIQGQYVHYMEWGGRSIVHTIAQCLLWAGEFWGDLLNTLAYVAFVLIVYSIANKGSKTNIFLFIIINVLIWFSLPDFSQNFLWITGSANYLWGGLIVVAFMYFYVAYYLNPENKKDTISRYIVFLLFGIIAGWTNENMAVALIFFTIGIIILLKIQKTPVPKWMLFGLAGAIIGCIIMLAAPGNFERSKVEFLNTHKMEKVELSYYFYRMVTIVKFSKTYILPLILLYGAMLVLYFRKGKPDDNKKKVMYLSLLVFAASLVATISMAASPSFPPRAWYGIIILLVLAFAVLYANLDFSDKTIKIANIISFAIILCVYIISCVMSYKEIKKYNELWQARDNYIEENKSKGIKDDIVMEGIFHQSQSKLVVLNLEDWLKEDYWAFRYGKFRGVNSFKVVESTNGKDE